MSSSTGCSERPILIEVNGVELPFFLHVPSVQEESPVVIMFHGFTGNKIENARLFVNLSRALCERGIGSVRFDFRGHGEGPGSFEDFDIEQAISDAKAVVEKASKFKEFNESGMGILGLSMGGQIAIRVAHDINRIKAAALLSPAIDFSGIRRRLAEGSKDGYVYWDSMRMRVDKLTKIAEYNAMEIAGDLRVPLLIVHSKDDAAVPYSQSVNFYQRLKVSDKRLILLEEGDHVFSKFEVRANVIKEVVDWFSARL